MNLLLFIRAKHLSNEIFRIFFLSNLSSANIDPGLMHSIGFGYHKDIQTRAAFIEVLTKILQQVTEFDTLAKTVPADHFDQLVQLVTMIGDKGELPIAMALASVVVTPQIIKFLAVKLLNNMNLFEFFSQDQLARVFLTLFDANYLLAQLPLNIFTRRSKTLIACILFRGNSLASKVRVGEHNKGDALFYFTSFEFLESP